MVRRDMTKRKAETDHKNKAFNVSLQERLSRDEDFLEKNKMILRSMGQGRLPPARIDLPEGVDVFMYS